jgi:hypothetical protein
MRAYRWLGWTLLTLVACDGPSEGASPPEGATATGGKADAAEPCCDPVQEPFTIDGTHCCADGTWVPDIGNGDPSVCDDRGGVGEVCEPPACCDPSEEPFTIDGAHCCADGTWVPDPGNGDPSVCDPYEGLGAICE